MIETAIAAARAAGSKLRKSFGHEVKINESSAYDVKIQEDIDTQDLIYSMILKKFPDHKLLGEEGNSGNPKGEIEWIVDPIDGTLNFTYGIPHFCISIAARKGTQTLLGVIYDPMRDELFTTVAGEPAMLNGHPQKVSSRKDLKEAVLTVGLSKSVESVEHGLKLLEFYARKAKKIRSMGSAALDLAYISCGRLDAYIEQGISLWDYAAGALLVQQAGGFFEAKERANGKHQVFASNNKIDFPLR